MLPRDEQRHSWKTVGLATLAAGTAVMGVVAVTMTVGLVILFVVVGYTCATTSDAYQAQQREAERKADDPEGYAREQAKWRRVPSPIPGMEVKERIAD